MAATADPISGSNSILTIPHEEYINLALTIGTKEGRDDKCGICWLQMEHDEPTMTHEYKASPFDTEYLGRNDSTTCCLRSLHRDCFAQYLTTQKPSKVLCPYCRGKIPKRHNDEPDSDDESDEPGPASPVSEPDPLIIFPPLHRPIRLFITWRDSEGEVRVPVTDVSEQGIQRMFQSLDTSPIHVDLELTAQDDDTPEAVAAAAQQVRVMVWINRAIRERWWNAMTWGELTLTEEIGELNLNGEADGL